MKRHCQQPLFFLPFNNAASLFNDRHSAQSFKFAHLRNSFIAYVRFTKKSFTRKEIAMNSEFITMSVIFQQTHGLRNMAIFRLWFKWASLFFFKSMLCGSFRTTCSIVSESRTFGYIDIDLLLRQKERKTKTKTK